MFERIGKIDVAEPGKSGESMISDLPYASRQGDAVRRDRGGRPEAIGGDICYPAAGVFIGHGLGK